MPVSKTSAKQNNMNPVEEVLATETDPDNVPHTYFDSVELGSVGSAKGNKNMVTVKINDHSTKMKVDTGADATVIPYDLYKKITRKPLQKIQQPLKPWLATKPIHPVGCV